MSRSPRLGQNPVPLRLKVLALTITLCLLAALVPQGFIKFAPVAEAAGSPTLVISQVYGGGGNSGATIKNDFIEIFNRGTTTVNLSGWSVQYASSAGTSWAVTPLSGSIAPGKYYLVQEAAGTGGTVSLVPDATGSIAMSATAGKVALVTSTTPLTGSCPTGVVDFVGFGAANCSEGSPTATLSNTTAALRANDGCTDTDVNSADFTIGSPTPRNSLSASKTCPSSNASPSITTPANPITTVDQDAAPFTVSLSGTDDNNVFNWGATAGTGVSSVTVNGSSTNSSVTYTVTLAPGFSGTATFTASLSDNVNPAVTKQVNIAVTPVVANDPPTINTPANPIVTVAQDAAPFTVGLSGADDNNIFNWGATAGTGISTVSVTGGQGTANPTFTVALQPGFSGTASFTASLSDNINPQVLKTVNIAVTPAPLDHVVISEIYGGGGNSGAAFRNDYVELYNATTGPVDLGGWTIQYASSTGSSWQAQPLGGIMQPGEYYLVSLASGGAVGAELPLPNIGGSINMSGTTGKVALVSAGDPLDGPCPIGDPTVVDFVGYGTANCREGSTNAPAPSNSTSISRKNGGATDTNSNGADFTAGAGSPTRTTPITEIGPYVLSVDPRANNTIAPRDANISITFTEDVSVDLDQNWFNISCANTGTHNDATFGQGGARNWIIVPNVNFQPGEQCTVTVFKDFVHDTDMEDSAPGTDTLKANYTWSFKVATGNPPVYGPEVNTAMGNPSGATADLDNYNNYLMVKPEFTLSYNRDRGTPNWVSWHLDDTWVGSLDRVDTFRADPAVPSDWYRVLGTDYFASGFDRGHMVPNADRDDEDSRPVNQATFLMTNMIPQAPDNNQGPWANMENYLRTLLPANELYIVAGGAGTGGVGSSGPASTIANGKITVPAQTWKVVLVLPKDAGDDVARVTAATRTIAVIMPNTQGIRTSNPNDWQAYLTTVDAVEGLTGYNFFSNLPDSIENAIEAGTNGNNPPGTANMSVNTQEDTPAVINLDVANPTSSALTYTILTGPQHGTLTGGPASPTYTPAPNYNGSDTFTYRVSNGSLTSNTSTVTINIAAVNDAPEIAGVPAGATINEHETYSFKATATDAENSSLTFSLEGAPDGAAIDPSTGDFSWTPSETQGGASYPFVVRVSDGTDYTDAPITITVNEVNADPTLAAIPDSTVELGNTLSFTAQGDDTDVPDQTLTYSLTGTVPAGATIDSGTGIFSWTPSAGQAGATHAITIRVTDNGSPVRYADRTFNVAVAYTWSGPLSPVNADGTSVFKLGRTIPLKFKLTGASAGISTAVARATIAKVTNNVVGNAVDAEATGNANDGNLFRYDPTTDQYVFNLSTKGLTPGTYQLRVDMGDGVARIITFGLN